MSTTANSGFASIKTSIQNVSSRFREYEKADLQGKTEIMTELFHDATHARLTRDMYHIDGTKGELEEPGERLEAV